MGGTAVVAGPFARSPRSAASIFLHDFRAVALAISNISASVAKNSAHYEIEMVFI